MSFVISLVAHMNQAPAGRGRGRGGGVPLLPEGLFKTLTSGSKELTIEAGQFDDGEGNDAHDDDKKRESNNVEDEDDADAGEVAGKKVVLTLEEKRARFSNKDNNNRQPKGPAADLKGKDWNCAACNNLNWSWRAQCNTCKAPKPEIFAVWP